MQPDHSQIHVTEAHIRESASLQRSIQTLKSTFFNEQSLDPSSYNVASMNIHEQRFFKKMVQEHLDIIKIFPALYCLQA